MASNLIHEFHSDFSGGVNQYPGSLLKAENETDLIENGELDQFGPIRKTKGYLQKGNDVNANYNILGLCSAYKSDGTQKQIAVADGIANSDAYTYNPINGQWTKHNLSLTSGAKAEFESFLDGFFMCNFEDATRWNNITQWYTTTNVTNAPKAKYIKLYLSRIYLAYCVDSGTTLPSRVIYSDLPDGNPLTITWNNTVNYFDVDSDDGDVIKGLGENANRLLVFKENSLHRYDTNSRYKVPGCPGTISHRTVRNIQGWTLYLHSTGIWGYDGTTSRLLSRNIKDIILGISTKNFANSCAWVKEDHYYLFVGDVVNTESDVNIPKCLIDYDISKNAFTWRSLEKTPLVFNTYKDDRSNVVYDKTTLTYNSSDTSYGGLISSEDRVYFGDTSGAIYHFDTGNQMDGTDISFRVITKDYYLGNPSIFKSLQKLVVYCDSGKHVTIQYKMDDGNWKTLGRVKESITDLEFPAASRCRKVKFRISDSSGGDTFNFEGFDIYFVPETLEK